MISTKRHAQQLAFLLQKRNIREIVISPGSRSGPLVHTLSGSGHFRCHTVVDERSAAYFALGMAQYLQEPVVLLCSSGTATLNYGPAVAEASAQEVPLVVVTADRPAYWIGQLENQCLEQQGIYLKNVRKSCTLPLEESEEQLWFAARKINELLNAAVHGKKGPVHLNIPFEEPLHEREEREPAPVRIVECLTVESHLTDQSLAAVQKSLAGSSRILILPGQQLPEVELIDALHQFATMQGAVILAEHLANFPPRHMAPHLLEAVDPLLQSIDKKEAHLFQPDLLITFGRHMVSKVLKQFLRRHPPRHHLHVGSAEHIDTYQALTTVIPLAPHRFFRQLTTAEKPATMAYLSLWQKRQQSVRQIFSRQRAAAPFSDLQVYGTLFQRLPQDSVIHIGNSSPIRYALLNPRVSAATYLGNRGTSGIDGSLSTAIGYARYSAKINTVILGDLSFFYDSNGLWNNSLGGNLRIIVINNGGGNIFGLLESLAATPAFDRHFFARHQAKAEQLAAAFGLDSMNASSQDELEAGLAWLYHPARATAALLEVFTEAATNTMTYKKLIAAIKTESGRESATSTDGENT